MLNEDIIFLAASLFFGWAVLDSLVGSQRSGKNQLFPLILLAVAVLLTTGSITLRWLRLDHGPYVGLRETLISGVWGYHLAILLACLFIPRIRPMMRSTLPVLFVLVVWALFAPSRDSLLPVTYNTFWLPVHVVFGKIFIGCTVVAVGLASVTLLRKATAWQSVIGPVSGFAEMPHDTALEELTFRFMLAGFAGHTMMLISGAVWAEDAWGRLWAWDPLETWSFITWILSAAYLHLRVTQRSSATINALAVCLVFCVAFFTFFGVPFFSTAAHKGMV